MHNLTFSSFFYKFLTTLTVVALALASTPVQPVYAATLTVNSLADTQNNADGVCTLREAIINANADLGTWTNCAAGTGNDTIVFDIPSATPTITLGTTLPTISDLDGLTIDGTNLNAAGGTVTVSGNNLVRIALVSAGVPVTFQDLILSNAASGNGAAINNSGNLTVNNVTFQNNVSTGNGGAIIITATGSLTVANSTFTGNTASFGGAIFHNGTTLLTVTNSTFSGNTLTVSAAGDGGAIDLITAGSSASISDSTFTSNSAQDDGGAIFSNGISLIVTNSTFQSNSAGNAGLSATTGADGGAIRNTVAIATITLSTFINNSISMPANVAVHGGAIENDGAMTIANSTFSGNSLSQTAAGTVNASGGGVYATGATTIHNTTFSGNSVSENGTGFGTGGSIHSVASSITIANSILAGGTENGAPGNCGGSVVNGLNNVEFGSSDCGFAITANPLLGGLTGSPAYFPLGPGSSAIDTGDNTICANASSTNNESQNGVTRPQDGDGNGTAICDIGSYEAPNTNTAPTVTTPIADVNVLEDAVNTVFSLFPNFEDAQSSDAQLTYTVTANTNPSLFTSVDITDPANFTLDYAPDANGTADITIRAADPAGLFVEDTFTVTVTAVNDMPDFTGFNPPAVNEDAGPQSTSIVSVQDMGPADEDATQSVLAYIVSNSNCGTLLSAGPSVDTAGVLTYTPSPNQSGTCTFDLQLQDNGGTANGGVDTSPVHSFTITVNAVNDAPTDISLSNSSIAENNAINDVIGTLSATDIDAGETFVFSLTCSTPGADDGSFNINGTDLRASVVFDFETKNSYSICIRVTDQGGAGLSFDKNFTISIIDVDELAPDTTITSNPSNPSNSSSATFSFTGIDSGGSGIAGFECSLDGALFASCASPQTYTGLSDGTHTFLVRAIDNLGNVDASPASFPWTVDTTAPDVTINQAAGQSDPTSSSPIEFTVVFNEAVTGFDATDVNLSGTAGGTLVVSISGTGPTYTVSVTGMTTSGTVIATIPAGAAQDPAGNASTTSASTDNTVTFDNTLPDTVIDSSPSNPSNSTSATFTFSSPASDLAGFECKLDSSAFAACTTPQSYSGLSLGSHTFEVRAVDTVGNMDPSPASYTWLIDLGFPTVTGSTPASNETVDPGLTKLTVTFSEDVKSDGSTGAANNIANYLLVENGDNNIFNTVSCAGGVVADDTNISILSATYSNNGGSGPFVATLTVPPLSVGTYRLFVCGTTSIEDLSGNKLNNGASDSIITFRVAQPARGGNAGSKSLPATGFAMNQITALPFQPADKAYASTDLWLEIPTLGVKMSIVGVPFKDGAWDVKWLDKNAGWLNGSAYPTWNGNSVITGHVWDALNKPGPFAEVKKLKYGDQIKIHAYGQVYVYEVRASESVSPIDTAKVFKHEEKSWITMLTCEDYKELSQTYSSRRMVRAVLVSVIAEK